MGDLEGRKERERRAGRRGRARGGSARAVRVVAAWSLVAAARAATTTTTTTTTTTSTCRECLAEGGERVGRVWCASTQTCESLEFAGGCDAAARDASACATTRERLARAAALGVPKIRVLYDAYGRMRRILDDALAFMARRREARRAKRDEMR